MGHTCKHLYIRAYLGCPNPDRKWHVDQRIPVSTSFSRHNSNELPWQTHLCYTPQVLRLCLPALKLLPAFLPCPINACLAWPIWVRLAWSLNGSLNSGTSYVVSRHARLQMWDRPHGERVGHKIGDCAAFAFSRCPPSVYWRAKMWHDVQSVLIMTALWARTLGETGGKKIK